MTKFLRTSGNSPRPHSNKTSSIATNMATPPHRPIVTMIALMPPNMLLIEPLPPLRHFSTAAPSRFATTPHSAQASSPSQFAQPFPSLFASCCPNRKTGSRFGPATPTTSHLPQVSSPRSPHHHVRITKYNSGKDAVDSEQIRAIATASLPSELQFSFLPATTYWIQLLSTPPLPSIIPTTHWLWTTSRINALIMI
jgi:hypothetical protein